MPLRRERESLAANCSVCSSREVKSRCSARETLPPVKSAPQQNLEKMQDDYVRIIQTINDMVRTAPKGRRSRAKCGRPPENENRDPGAFDYDGRPTRSAAIRSSLSFASWARSSESHLVVFRTQSLVPYPLEWRRVVALQDLSGQLPPLVEGVSASCSAIRP